MAAEVESMMYAGETPWHGLGTYVGATPVTSAVALQESGLDWTVSTTPVCYEHNGESRVAGDHCVVVRDSDSKPLGVAGKGYTPIQNREAFAFLDGIGEGFRFETAMSLRGGRIVAMLGVCGEKFEIVNGDTVVPYIAAVTSHDGSLALQAFPTCVRVVCMNTVRAALAKKGGSGVVVKHTASAESRLQAAQETLKFSTLRIKGWREQCQLLAQRPMSATEFTEFAVELLEAKELTTRVKNQVDTLSLLMDQGRGQDIKGVHGTRWAAYNAVTEYTTWERSTRVTGEDGEQGSRFHSAILGSGDKLNQRALDLLMAV